MSTLLRKAQTAGVVAKALGGKWVVARAGLELRHRSGLLKRQLPAIPWGDIPLTSWLTDSTPGEPAEYAAWRNVNAPRFFFRSDARANSVSTFAEWDQESGGPVAGADRTVAGTFRYFSHLDVELGEYPDWHRNAITGEVVPPERHWTEIGDFGYGDIKVIWEPSRFAWAYELVRAYWRTGDERYPERFWRLLENWREANPPNLGPNWKCGQEASLRVMAWSFALCGFGDAQATTPERMATLVQMIAFSGKRIEANLGYALSQRNNHGVSEGTGLWTIGMLFPELRDAQRWSEKGRDVLERLGGELIYEDGGFSQQSTNYHRVMLHAYAWSLRLGDVTGQRLSDGLRAKVGQATELLYQLQDSFSGQVPNYGANDGALILPLASCPYEDYRPVIQVCRYLAEGVRTHTGGPWDEAIWWLFGADGLESPVDLPERRNLNTSSGYLTLRSEKGFAFLRAPSVFRDRPSHADVTHLDVWWRGINIATDPGTYSYNASTPWSNGLTRTAVHNTVTVDDANQMDQVGRFLWAPWLRAGVDGQMSSSGRFFDCLLIHHDGYLRLDDPVNYHRAIVRLGDEHWLVVDWLEGHAKHRYRLHWLLEDLLCEPARNLAGVGDGVLLRTQLGPFRVVCGVLNEEKVTADIERSAPDSTNGWRSTHYLGRTPAVSMSTEVMAHSAVFWSVLGPDASVIQVGKDTLELQLDTRTVNCTFTQRPVAIRLAMTGHGSERDVLECTPSP